MNGRLGGRARSLRLSTIPSRARLKAENINTSRLRMPPMAPIMNMSQESPTEKASLPPPEGSMVSSSRKRMIAKARNGPATMAATTTTLSAITRIWLICSSPPPRLRSRPASSECDLAIIPMTSVRK